MLLPALFSVASHHWSCWAVVHECRTRPAESGYECTDRLIFPCLSTNAPLHLAFGNLLNIVHTEFLPFNRGGGFSGDHLALATSAGIIVTSFIVMIMCYSRLAAVATP